MLAVLCVQVAKELSEKLPSVRLQVFSDRDLEPKRAQIVAALESADVFFGSLLFDYDQVEWLKSRVDKIPVRLVFESALELMSSTQIGTFQVCNLSAVVSPMRKVCARLSIAMQLQMHRNDEPHSDVCQLVQS